MGRKKTKKTEDKGQITEEILITPETDGGLDSGLMIVPDEKGMIVADEEDIAVNEEFEAFAKLVEIDFDKPVLIHSVRSGIVVNTKVKRVDLREGQRAVLSIKGDSLPLQIWVAREYQLKVTIVNVNYEDKTIVVEANSQASIGPNDIFLMSF